MYIIIIVIVPVVLSGRRAGEHGLRADVVHVLAHDAAVAVAGAHLPLIIIRRRSMHIIYTYDT